VDSFNELDGETRVVRAKHRIGMVCNTSKEHSQVLKSIHWDEINDAPANPNQKIIDNAIHSAMDSAGLGCIAHIIKEYARLPVCTVVVGDGIVGVWEKEIYKFPFNGFPTDIVPVCGCAISLKWPEGTDALGMFRTKIMLHVDHIIFGEGYYGVVDDIKANLCKKLLTYLEGYNAIIMGNRIYKNNGVDVLSI
jgi:hypothetical protein